MVLGRDRVEHELHDGFGAGKARRAIPDAQDQHLVSYGELAARHVANDLENQTGLAGPAGSDDLHALRRLEVDERSHRLDISAGLVEAELTRAHVHAGTAVVGRGIVEHAQLVDVAQAHGALGLGS